MFSPINNTSGGKKIMRNVKVMVSSLTAVAMLVGVFAVTSNAGPPVENRKQLNIEAESFNVIRGLNPVNLGFPIIESTGFETVDGWDPPGAITGFNGYMCGVEFADCDPLLIQDDGSCLVAAFDNCCIDNPNPDNSWYMSNASKHCKEPHIDTVNPSSGLQHLRFTRASGLADGHPDGCISFGVDCRTTAFSPYGNGDDTALPVAPYTISIDVASTGRASSNFRAWYLPEGGAKNWGLELFWLNNGGIYYYERGAFRYLTEWIAGPYSNMTVTVDPCNRVTQYIYNGVVVLELSRSVLPLSENTPWINRSILRTNNAGEIWDVDNYSVERGVPCPVTCGQDGMEPGEQCEFETVCFGGSNDGLLCTVAADCPDGGDCLDGDALCPGRCIAAGEVDECQCIPVHTNPCTAAELDNGLSSFLTDGGWYTFVADTPSTAIDTCGTSGFDSFLVIFDVPVGDCNDVGRAVGFNDDCGSDPYGAYSDPLASCFDAAGPGQGPGRPFPACTCVATTVGTRYWVWHARAGGLGTDSVINLTKRLDCAVNPVNGTCCDDSRGACTEVADAASCTGAFVTFTVGKACDSPSTATSCVESVSGACCDRLNGFCSNTLRSDCTGAQPLWTVGVTCGDVVCDPAVGACCNTRFGTCVSSIKADCPEQGTNLDWTKGDTCNELTCPDPFVPTVSEWGLVIMTLLLLIGAKVYFGRRGALA